MSKHEGRVVAITGGARGIGREIAAALSCDGALVAIGDIDEAAAKETAVALGNGTLGLSLDVTDRLSFAAFLETVERELGPLDVLVNNPGIMPTGAFEAETEEVTRRLVDINVHGVLLGCKLALGHMLPRGRGHLINVASGAGYVCGPGIVTYCGTKHAVVGITESLRQEYRRSGISVTAIIPGLIDTELITGLPDPRGMPKVAPSVVAAAVARAIERPRASVFVPRRVGLMSRIAKALPARVNDGLLTLMGATRGYLDSDPEARAAYDRRIGTKS